MPRNSPHQQNRRTMDHHSTLKKIFDIVRGITTQDYAHCETLKQITGQEWGVGFSPTFKKIYRTEPSLISETEAVTIAEALNCAFSDHSKFYEGFVAFAAAPLTTPYTTDPLPMHSIGIYAASLQKYMQRPDADAVQLKDAFNHFKRHWYARLDLMRDVFGAEKTQPTLDIQ